MVKKLLEPSTLLPCMVVIVTCMGNDGKPNMSTISEGGVLCNEPPILGISINRGHLSYRQIKETMEFVINIPPEDLIWETDVVGCISGRRKDKFELMQGRLTPIPSQVVKVPSLKECPVNIDHVSIIIDMRRYLVMEQAAGPGELNTIFTNIENNGAPWQFSPEDRLKWTE